MWMLIKKSVYEILVIILHFHVRFHFGYLQCNVIFKEIYDSLLQTTKLIYRIFNHAAKYPVYTVLKYPVYRIPNHCLLIYLVNMWCIKFLNLKVASIFILNTQRVNWKVQLEKLGNLQENYDISKINSKIVILKLALFRQNNDAIYRNTQSLTFPRTNSPSAHFIENFHFPGKIMM